MKKESIELGLAAITELEFLVRQLKVSYLMGPNIDLMAINKIQEDIKALIERPKYIPCDSSMKEF